MQIKVFKAPTMKEAMAAMKEELGDDAVILHSKKYKEGGVLGLGSKEVVEITAAVEESSLPQKDDNFRPTPPKRNRRFSQIPRLIVTKQAAQLKVSNRLKKMLKIYPRR